MSKERKKQILEFSDSSSESESENEQQSRNAFKINKSFANEYDKRKRRQELMNAKQGDDDDFSSESSSDESEDENAELLTPKVDLQILKVCVPYRFML